MRDNKEDTCPTCGGSGLVPCALACVGISVESCPTCGGSGKVELYRSPEPINPLRRKI